MHCTLMNDASVWNHDRKQRAPTVDDILKARELMAGTVRKTPLQNSRTFSRLAGTNLFLKLECQQVTGSFKVRGAFAKVSSLTDKHTSHRASARSAGHHVHGT